MDNSNTLKDLKVWQESRKFRQEVSQMVRSFPSDEKFRLVDQLIRASRSVTANIAEGHGRYHFQENIQFCRQARGSLVEIFDHLTCALDEAIIDQNKYDTLVQHYETIHKMINGYINYLRKRKLDG